MKNENKVFDAKTDKELLDMIKKVYTNVDYAIGYPVCLYNI